MSIDGFITCLTLLVGLYTIAPSVAKLRLRLLGWRIWVPSICIFLLIVYLLLFKHVALPCLSNYCSAIEFEADSRSLNDLAFVVAIIWLAILALAYRARAFSIRNYTTFRRLVEQLLSDLKYGELAELIEPHIDKLAARANRSHWLQRALDRVRLHGPKRSTWLELLETPDEEIPKVGHFEKIYAKTISAAIYAAKPVACLFPSEDRGEENARLTIRRILTNDGFVRYISQERPLLALSIMTTDRLDYYEFSDRSLTYMIEAPGGPLRQELWGNDNLTQCFYEIDPANVIIHFLFKNSRVAEKLEVYRPLGEFAINSIHDDSSYRRFLNSKPRDFDRAKKHDNLFLVCHFFDIMIRSAARDNIEWHMWLYYMNIIVGKVVKTIDVQAPEYDKNSEFPSYSHFIIYTIIRNLREWVEMFNCLEPGSVAVRIDSEDARHENGHIVKSAIISMGICLRELVQSENVTDEFIAYILEVILRARRAAQQHQHGARIAEALKNSILGGGPMGFQAIDGHRLLVCFAMTDHMTRFEHQDLQEVLAQRYG